jgi:hypothetical protein
MTMVPTHFRIIPMALTLPFGRIRQYCWYDTHNLPGIASLEPGECTSRERRLDVGKADAPHPAPLLPTTIPVNFRGVCGQSIYTSPSPLLTFSLLTLNKDRSDKQATQPPIFDK